MAAMKTYKVKKGDTLAKIAKEFQHRKWETIWNSPENKSLVSKRKKPECIEPGDELIIPPNEKEQADAKDKDKSYTVMVGGKKFVLAEKEFDVFKKEMLAALRQAVLACEIRANAARDYWKAFNDLNNDQKFVSWCVHLLGPKLPPESLIKAAEQAHEKLRSAVASGDFRKIETELDKAGSPINAAYKAMMDYKEATIGRSGKELALLEFTRDTSFQIVTAIATAELGGTPASDGAVGAASGIVKSAAGELGKYIAGTSGGGASAAKSVALAGVLGAVNGAMSALMKMKGEDFVEGVSEKAAAKMTGKWAARLGKERIEKFLARRLAGAASGGLHSAVTNVCKAIKGEETPGQVFAEIAKQMGLSATLNGIDPFMDDEFAPSVYGKLVAAGLRLTGKAQAKDVITIIADLAKDQNRDGVGKAMEEVFDAAKGSEKPEELGEQAAERFAKEHREELEDEILARLGKT